MPINQLKLAKMETTVKKSKFTLEQLERTSKNWDGRTKDILLFIGGAGNMFGGSGRMVHLTLHGENSIYETGSTTINGVVEYGYNISRGANGENSASAKYYKGADDFENIYSKEPNYTIEIKGKCGGYDAALCSILSAEKDFLIGR